MSNAVKINKCRICDNTSLVPCINLGEQYLSSVFPSNLKYHKNTKKYPLDLVLCIKNKNTCGTLQLAHDINLKSMYELYPYSSSTNSSMKMVLKDIVDSTDQLVKFKKDDLVLDIGGKDGTVLSFFKNKKKELFAICTAKNITQDFQSSSY